MGAVSFFLIQKISVPLNDFAQCLQNFLQALRKILQALQIFSPWVALFSLLVYGGQKCGLICMQALRNVKDLVRRVPCFIHITEK